MYWFALFHATTNEQRKELLCKSTIKKNNHEKHKDCIYLIENTVKM